jgi:multidrug efflux pump
MDRVLGGFFRRFNRLFHRGSEPTAAACARHRRKALMLVIYPALVG